MHANLSGPRACISVYCLRLLGRLAFAWALPQCVAHGSQAYDGLQMCIISVEVPQDSWARLLDSALGKDRKCGSLCTTPGSQLRSLSPSWCCWLGVLTLQSGLVECAVHSKCGVQVQQECGVQV